MAELIPADESAADRLAFHLLKDAYCDLAAVLRGAKPDAADALFFGIDKRIADSLARLHASGAEGPASQEIAVAVGMKIQEVLDQAHGRADPPAAEKR
ncbi:hypothetical protein [Methylobacterium oxalidis]|uniref:hypothetical protein n=1 Tax=Methylobacterium oxalidis TaxID=944322 RepID=UPI003314AD0E